MNKFGRIKFETPRRKQNFVLTDSPENSHSKHLLKYLETLTPTQLEHKHRLMQVLSRYLPASTIESCAELIMFHRLHLHIEVERKSRYGDYSPHEGKGNRISINHNLNPYEFLITFVHELSHHTAFAKYGMNHDPHGAEWKAEFQKNMKPFLAGDVFPELLLRAVERHMYSPRYSHSADINLMKALLPFNKNQAKILLDQLAPGTKFKMKGSSITFEKKEKLRSYYHCVDVSGKRSYRVHALAEVEPL